MCISIAYMSSKFLCLQGMQVYTKFTYTNLQPAAYFAELYRIAKLMLAICKIHARHTHMHKK